MASGMNPAWSILMLLAVLAMIPAGAWLVRRLTGLRAGTTRSLAVLETLHIGPRERLLVIRAGTQTLLIGATGQSINLLTTLAGTDPAPWQPGAEVPENPAFADVLTEARDVAR